MWFLLKMYPSFLSHLSRGFRALRFEYVSWKFDLNTDHISLAHTHCRANFIHFKWTQESTSFFFTLLSLWIRFLYPDSSPPGEAEIEGSSSWLWGSQRETPFFSFFCGGVHRESLLLSLRREVPYGVNKEREVWGGGKSVADVPPEASCIIMSERAYQITRVSQATDER